jgi:predicted chitinase
MNADTLVKCMPGLSGTKAQQYLAPMERAMVEFDITSEMRSRMWLAQAGHESGSLVYFEEIASGAAYEGRKDLGNTQPGDGVKYKGRGPIQITGRYNYTKAQEAMGVPLVDQPQLAADPFKDAFRISAWWWKANGLNEISDKGDVVAATKRINGGTNGLSDRQKRYDLAKAQGAKVVVSANIAPPGPALTSGDEDFIIQQPDGEVLLLVYGGPDTYWRPLPVNAVSLISDSLRVKDDGSLKALWKVGAGK